VKRLAILLGLAAAIAVLIRVTGPGPVVGWLVILGVIVWSGAVVEALRSGTRGR
jgi:hypothetical protein